MKYIHCKIFSRKFLKGIFIICILFFNVHSLLAANSSECIEKYKSKLVKGGWEYGFSCKRGSSFTRINARSNNYIIYNYIYRFLTHKGGAIHGGQRLVFFDLDYNYIGQFYLPLPETTEASSIKILSAEDKNTLILSDGQKPVGNIILSRPPKGVLYGDTLDFFK